MNKFWGGMRILSIVLILVILSLSIIAEESNPTIESTPPSSNDVASAPTNDSDQNTTVSESPAPNNQIFENNSANTTVNATTSLPPSQVSVSVVANPTVGNAPLIVQFTAIATGKSPITYSWDFNGDNVADSTKQNPSSTFNAAGNYSVKVTAADATGESASELIPITVTTYDSHLSLSSYFPTEFNKGANQITFIVSNDGTETINNIAARIVGDGVEYLTSTTLPTLSSGDKDSITVKVNILKSGTLSATAKILDKNFPLTLDVTQQVQYDKTELETKLQDLKYKLSEQQKVYNTKKADGYLVSDIPDQIKRVQDKAQDAEQQLLTGKLADASISLHLTESGITDLANNLEVAQQPKVTILQWVKENAIAIAAIIAAFGTIGGVLLKLKHHAAKAAEHAGKFGKDVVKKKWFGKKGEVQASSSPEAKDTEPNPLTDEEK